VSGIDSGPPAGEAAGTPGPARVPAPSPWNLPNALTVLRILLVPVFGWLLLSEDGQSTGYRLAAFGVFVVAMITDSVDGDIARRKGLVTDFGKVSDPIADKALVGMGLVALSVIDLVPWWITVVILVREIGITAMRFLVIRHGVMPAGRGGKLKTGLQTAALSMLIFPLTVLPLAGLWQTMAFGLLVAALVVTVVTGVDYVTKARQLRRTSPRAAANRARRAGRQGP
jgi:CDP-diacylglycerol--glycerol-3-phosphate 3-phosphatidyltransferase